MIKILKNIWNGYLAIIERKTSFFNGNMELVNSKHWNYFYRSFKDISKVLFYDNIKKKLYLKIQDDIIISTDDYYYIVHEIFSDNIYSLPPQISERDFVVFDAGMNRAYASLYFANMPHCKAVYGFELDYKTYQFAEENISLNILLSEKISIYNFGLWNENTTIDILSGEKDSRTVIKQINVPIDLHQKNKADVRKSSEVFSKLFKTIDTNYKKILKIDIEGSEYVVMEDLFKHNLIQEFDFIIGEYHDGLDKLKPYLEDFKCMYNSGSSNDKMGMMVYIKK